jgi:alkanesulfonate monooxygenase SsuD/methylene tetrahydromethanopterin reductase-like flavin-dependent oxidoreductase (luciferase family)
MKISLFYELQLPRPWDEGSEERIIHEAIEQIELADSLGFHTIWEVEHHFLEEYSHSSAPETFLAAISQRTKNIRLGHGIQAILPAYNHPARLVERASMLDLLSGGRVDFGMGESTTRAELHGFGVALEEKMAIFDEVAREIPKMFAETPYPGFKGEHFSMPPRNIIPKSKQKPHPPLWMACSNINKIEQAARVGVGVLYFAFANPESARQHVTAYYDTMENESVPIGYAVNPNLVVNVGFHTHASEQTALDRGMDGVQFFAYSLLHFAYFGEHRPGVTDVYADFERNREALGLGRGMAKAEGRDLSIVKSTPAEEELERKVPFLQPGALQALRGAVGSVGQVRRYLQAYEDVGVDQVMFNTQIGKTRHEDIMESLELFGREVLPEIMDRDEKAASAKAAKVARISEKALARREKVQAAGEHVVESTRGPMINAA